MKKNCVWNSCVEISSSDCTRSFELHLCFLIFTNSLVLFFHHFCISYAVPIWNEVLPRGDKSFNWTERLSSPGRNLYFLPLSFCYSPPPSFFILPSRGLNVINIIDQWLRDTLLSIVRLTYRIQFMLMYLIHQQFFPVFTSLVFLKCKSHKYFTS